MRKIKVNQIETNNDVLDEAKERITKLMKKRRGKEFDFEERLQDACKEVWERNQEAREKIRTQRDIAEEELDYIRASLSCSHS